MSERQPTILSVFSGIAGLDLAFHSAGFRTLAFVEWDATKQIILRAHFPTIPIYGDIDTFDCAEFLRTHGCPDVIAGGPPCQAASLLGKRMGTSDGRWKWGQTVRLVGEIRPRYCVFENPTAILTLESGRAFNGVVSQMAALGYDGWWDVIPAAAFGAGHWRERLCIVFADANFERRREARDGIPEGESRDKLRIESAAGRGGALPANSYISRLQGHRGDGSDSSRWSPPRRPVATPHLPDLRGRVNGPAWWYELAGGVPVIPASSETHPGVPIFHAGIPNKLVAAAALCAGDAVCPQAWQPIAQALFTQIQTEGAKPVLT